MPFVRGRYYANPIAGQALEAAREAEEKLAASRVPQESDTDAEKGQGETSEPAPIRRIEIDATELVPAHAGRATKGYVARVHRHGVAQLEREVEGPTESHVFYDTADLVKFLTDEFSKSTGESQARG